MAKIIKTKLSQMIAEAAYYRAEKRNFEPGYELQDWLEAEQAITFSLKSAKRLIATKIPIQATVATTRKKSVKTARMAKASTKRAARKNVTADPN